MFLSAGCSLLRAEGFFCNLDVLYGALGIHKLQFLIQNKCNFFSAVNFFQYLVIKPWIRIRIGILPKMLDLDPDPYQMNTDPKPWFLCTGGVSSALNISLLIYQCTCFYMAPVLNHFYGDKVHKAQIHYSGHWEGWALKISAIWS
jgi:hypothetical protein